MPSHIVSSRMGERIRQVQIEGVKAGGRRERDWQKRYHWALRVEQKEQERETGFALRREWGPGEWNSEPDLLEWRHPENGLPCLAVRAPTGAWCGYVGLPGRHPDFGKHYDKVREESAHGGLTFSGTCRGGICHVAQDGDPETVWWLGFDCAHSGDLAPGLEAMTRRHRAEVRETYRALFGGQMPDVDDRWKEHYRNLLYVIDCVEALGNELGGPVRRRRWSWMVDDLVAGVKLFFRRDLPEMWREIYLEQDNWGRGPNEREMMQEAYGGERWDPNGLTKVAKARRRDRPWPSKDRW